MKIKGIITGPDGYYESVTGKTNTCGGIHFQIPPIEMAGSYTLTPLFATVNKEDFGNKFIQFKCQCDFRETNYINHENSYLRCKLRGRCCDELECLLWEE